jgi:hypothetical protein
METLALAEMLVDPFAGTAGKCYFHGMSFLGNMVSLSFCIG